MNKLIHLLAVTLLALLVGCASSKPEPATAKDALECRSGDSETDLACLRAQNDMLASQNNRLRKVVTRNLGSGSDDAQASSGGPSATAAKSVPQGAGEGGYQVVGRRVMWPVGGNQRNGCEPGYNFDVANRTPLLCEAQSSQAWHRCGDGGVVQRWVRLPNGQSRLADLIPPGQNGHFYFDPLLGGSGRQEVTTRCYAASSVDGFDPRTPLVAVGRAHTDPADMPDTESAYGRHAVITGRDVM